jgi:acyl-CoA synthetase (NDP forming)
MTEPAAALTALLRAQSIALVGATERSSWARSAYENLRRMNYAGRIVPVNPSGAEFFGLPSVRSCADIEGEVDVALLMVPSKAIPGVIAELAGIGAKNAILLSSGFAETGEAGEAMQRDIVDSARRAGIRLLGPNCLGFVNFTDGGARRAARLDRHCLAERGDGKLYLPLRHPAADRPQRHGLDRQ